jgi:RNA polymerase sigma factor for flagellar operon FliA
MSAAPTFSDSVRSISNNGPASAGFDEHNFQTLVEKHLPLVRSIVERMKRKLPQRIEAEELFSVGVTGLVAAARNYRASQVGSFSGYASTRIRGAILDELRRMDWMSRGSRSKAKRLGSAISRLEQEQGGAVHQEALCAEMQMTEEELQELMDEMRPLRIVSLDSPDEQGEMDDQSLHEVIADDCSVSAYDVVERKEIIALLAERITQLPEIPKKVLAMYYYENLRLADIASCFGLTESRICQIHTQAVGQLRAYMQGILS